MLVLLEGAQQGFQFAWRDPQSRRDFDAVIFHGDNNFTLVLDTLVGGRIRLWHVTLCRLKWFIFLLYFTSSPNSSSCGTLKAKTWFLKKAFILQARVGGEEGGDNLSVTWNTIGRVHLLQILRANAA